MTAYYNEFDPFAAQWLRNLIAKGLIAPGEVDDRSITEVQPDDLKGFTQCHFFAGIGGWSLALRMAGWPDDKPVWTASCPCQPFSQAGNKEGKNDERHLWPETFRIVSERKPTVIFGEQVSAAIGKEWLDEVSSDMGTQGYTTGAIVFPGALVEADHERKRLYWVCDSSGERRERFNENRDSVPGVHKQEKPIASNNFAYARNSFKKHQQHILQRDGLSIGMERNLIKGYGNAIIPQAASLFIKAYMEVRP